jgi:hypothetical protein
MTAVLLIMQKFKERLALTLGRADVTDPDPSADGPAFLRQFAVYQQATITTILAFFWVSLLSLNGYLSIPIIPDTLAVTVKRYIFYPITYAALIVAARADDPTHLIYVAWASIMIPVLILAANPLLHEIVVNAMNSGSLISLATNWKLISNMGVCLISVSSGVTSGVASFPSILFRLGETSSARTLQLYSTFAAYAADLSTTYILFQILGLFDAAAPFYIVAWKLSPLLQYLGKHAYLLNWGLRFAVSTMIVVRAFTLLYTANMLRSIDSDVIAQLVKYFVIQIGIYGATTWLVVEKMTGLVLLACYTREARHKLQQECADIEMSTITIVRG